MLNELKNYYKISEMLHTSAQPTIDQFSRIRDSAIETIINLAEINSPDAIENEADIVYKNSMDYIHIPIDFEKPSVGELESFFNIMTQQSDKKILVHCAYNWRVSCFVYLYRILKKDVLREIAEKDMLNVWQPNETWQSFITNSIQMRQKK